MNLKFLRPKTFESTTHRYGWNWVVQQLYNKYHKDNATVIFDDFIEKTFDWDYATNARYAFPHWNTPWVGIIHNPFIVPKPFDIKHSSLSICSKVAFIKALPYCKGLISLSKDHANNLKYFLAHLGASHVPVIHLKHPIPINQPNQFDFDKFIKSPRITNIGYWLRNFEPFLSIRSAKYDKHILLGKLEYAHQCFDIQKTIYEAKCQRCNIKYNAKYKVHGYLDNAKYDTFLSTTISFLNLFDTSANNAVLECISKNIPLLVNPHPAVVEYLGDDYPLYYMDSHDIEEKIEDFDLIRETVKYLENKDKIDLTVPYFMKMFDFSEIMSNI
jgi:hypothetical protein